MQKTQNTVALYALTSLFFFWGLLTCLNDILVPHLRGVFSLTYFQSALVQFAFFLSYFCSSMPAGTIVGRWGFKTGIVIGLMVAGAGALLFIPASLLSSFPFFLLGLFVLASGITLLQVSANPYVTILGPEETASSRLNLTQAFNSLGTTVAPLLGGWLILSADSSTQTAEAAAQSVIGPYLCMGLLLLGMSVFFMTLKLEKASESVTRLSYAGIRAALKQKQLLGGTLGIFLYVGAEVSIGSFLVNYIANTLHLSGGEKEASTYVAVYWGLAAFGRFAGSFLMRLINPGKFLCLCAFAAVALIATTIASEGYTSVYAILAVGLCNSIMFPTIFSLGVRGLDTLTSIGSSLLIMAIVGGAIIPLMMGFSADHFGLKWSFVLPAACYIYIAMYGRFMASRT